ncbi:MAG TPA: ABC transporter substrate-binding protein, partial [Methyloceanibacter sp.]|nr:ABC transporter substrate-binding protein [Methyloceanibacter sp.]
MIGLKAPSFSRAASASFLGLMLCLSAPLNSLAQDADPATQRVSSLSDALLDTMRQAKELGIKGRYDKLAPVLAKTYDLPLMTRIAVGQSWDALTQEQRQAIVSAFTRMTTATYASRFDGFSGEQFLILQTLDQKNGDKIVKTHIIQSNGKPVALSYLVRKTGNDWRIIDVYLNGTISELANRRAEFGAVLKSSGAEGLVGSLNKQGDK